LVYQFGYDTGGKYLKSSNGKHTKCYSVWKDMLRRCYSNTYQSKHTTYVGCVVCDDWLDFQKFSEWFYKNYRDCYELDKDLLGCGKLYSPETCRFVPKDLNLLITNTRYSKARNYDLPLGVSEHNGKYIAWCNDGEGKTVNLGTKTNQSDAYHLYKIYKEDLIKKKAEYHYLKGHIDKDTKAALLNYEINPY